MKITFEDDQELIGLLVSTDAPHRYPGCGRLKTGSPCHAYCCNHDGSFGGEGVVVEVFTAPDRETGEQVKMIAVDWGYAWPIDDLTEIELLPVYD